MKFNNLTVEKANGCMCVTVDRPNQLNALNSHVLKELSQVVDQVESDDQIGVLVITGSGQKAFVAGADISEMQGKTALEALEFSRLGNRVFSNIENCSKPVIAAVNGFVLGGGCELAMACDIRIASDCAKFGQPEVNLGVTAGFGGSQRLPRLVGSGIAKQLLMTGEMIDAERAFQIGLVNKVVEQTQLMNEVEGMVQTLISKSPLGVRFSKKLVNEGMNMDLQRALEYESQTFSALFATEDQTEGMKAFLEKRNPNFLSK